MVFLLLRDLEWHCSPQITHRLPQPVLLLPLSTPSPLFIRGNQLSGSLPSDLPADGARCAINPGEQCKRAGRVQRSCRARGAVLAH